MVAHELAWSPICSVPAMCQGIPGWWKPYIAWVQVCSYTVVLHGTCMHHEYRLHGLVTHPPINRITEKIVALVAVFYLQCITTLKFKKKPNSQCEFACMVINNDLRSLIIIIMPLWGLPFVVSGDAPVGCWDGAVPGLPRCWGGTKILLMIIN